MYVFAFVGFKFFSVEFDSQDGSMICDTVKNCFAIIIDKCFKYDGGIGGYLASINELSDENWSEKVPIEYKRIAFDNFFYIFLLIVMINIVSGIIIDTFATERLFEKKIDDDTQNICFICGYTREELDMVSDKPDGFLHHIKNEHYQWNYLFYIAYLKDKEDTEFTG